METDAYHQQGYTGTTIFHLRNWLMDLQEEPRLACFHPGILSLLSFLEREDPHPFDWFGGDEWDTFVDDCFELAQKIDHFVRKAYRPGSVVVKKFPQVVPSSDLWSSFHREG